MIHNGERGLVGDGKPRRLPGALQCPSQSIHGEGLAQETREPHIPAQVHREAENGSTQGAVGHRSNPYALDEATATVTATT